MTITISGWFGFWIFMCVFVACEAWLMTKGIDGFFWGFKTAPEKELQKKLVEKAAQ